MSLLLDALKKAALEKQKRDQAQGGVGSVEQDRSPSKSKTTEPEAEIEVDIPELTLPEERDESLASSLEADTLSMMQTSDDDSTVFEEGELDFSTLEGLAQDAELSTEFLEHTEPASEETEIPTAELSLSPNDVVVEEEETLAVDESPLVTADTVTEPLNSLAPGPKQVPEAPSEVIVVNEAPSPQASANSVTEKAHEPENDEPSNEATVESSETSDDKSPANTKSEPVAPKKDEGKEAIAQLLSSGKSAARKRRIRQFLWLFILLLTAGGLVGGYYYYLQLDDGNNFYTGQPYESAPNQNEEDNLDSEDSSVEDEPMRSQDDGVDDQDTAVENEDIRSADNQKEETSDLENRQENVSEEPVLSVEVPEDKPPVTEEAKKTDSVSAKAKVSEKKGVKPVIKKAPLPKKVASKPAVVNSPLATVATKISEATPSEQVNHRPMDKINIISRGSRPSPLSEAIQRGYLAYQAGNYSLAEKSYAEALVLSPYHRDALLGAAAVAVKNNELGEALTFYQTRLARDPTDTHAKSGLLSLVASSQSSPKLEGEVNSLLREYPNAAHLHFLKGSLKAGGKQWGAAQAAFYKARRLEPGNADYAFNLGVSLDNLGQEKEALRYYREAQTLSFVGQANFDRTQLQQRVQVLEAQIQ
ncbi:MAG: tetratricopeptide repeat protein [Hahellaceae bacterium]|jgi:tetratricopeptide (TPR) repeat protein|nr:tetratricopeptide repeat protein [Hahellaceae bacterium]